MSVRECARAQGFPDYYIFKSVDIKPQRMVDNVSLIYVYVDLHILRFSLTSFTPVASAPDRKRSASPACANSRQGSRGGSCGGMGSKIKGRKPRCMSCGFVLKHLGGGGLYYPIKI